MLDILLFAAVISPTGVLSAPLPAPTPGEAALYPAASLAVLWESKDSESLAAAAVDVCESHNFAAIDELVSLLLKPSLKDRLDSKEDYLYNHPLRFTRVLVAIAKLPDDMAEAELGRISHVPDVLGNNRRLDALIYAAGEVRHPSPNLLRFLDDQATIQNGGGRAIASLARIATDESCALIEKRFLSKQYEIGSKTGWLRSELLVMRDRPAVVALYKRLFGSEEVEKEVREVLVQTLFDYQPEDWYNIDEPVKPQPPGWKQYSTAVLKELLEIANRADKLDISDRSKTVIARARKRIEAVLASRERQAQRGSAAADVSVPLAILRESKDPGVLVTAAEEICESQNAEAINQLTSILLKQSFQERLTPNKDDRFNHSMKWPISLVTAAMGRLPPKLAEANLGRCARDPDFIRRQTNAGAFVYGAAEVREPSASFLQLVDNPNLGEFMGNAIVRSLAKMATDDSCARIEKHLLSKDAEMSDKIGWLRKHLLVVRDHPAVIALYKRLLGSDRVEKDLREALVQTLFDYRPKEWSIYDAPPPRWKDCSTPVLEELLVVADAADKLDVSETAKASVARSRPDRSRARYA